MLTPMSTPYFTSIVDRLRGARVLVVGDLIVDHYIRGTSERISPEAPVPVVLFQSEESIPGGAANVARNIQTAGGRAVCVGVVGRDEGGALLRGLLGGMGVDTTGIVEAGDRATTHKTRVVALNQQMLRLDRETSRPVDDDTARAVVDAMERAMEGCGAVVLSDYAKGVLTPGVVRAAIERANALGIPLFVDPKGRDYGRYRGATALTPNAREAADASGHATATPAGLEAAAGEIIRQTGCRMLVITRGADGIALFEPPAPPLLLPTEAREVFDVTGAGDTFVAFLATAVAAGLPHADAAALANTAAGIAVGRTGAATVSADDLRAALDERASAGKVLPASGMGDLGRRLRAAGKRVVFTNGCFDFIHAGHVAFLQRARALGDVLVLATNADAVITRLKGAPRPIVPQEQRLRLLAAIEAVDHLTVFDADTPHDVIRELRPDVLVKGSNYAADEVEGHEIVEAAGGRVVLLDVVQGLSTGEMLGQRRPPEA